MKLKTYLESIGKWPQKKDNEYICLSNGGIGSTNREGSGYNQCLEEIGEIEMPEQLIAVNKKELDDIIEEIKKDHYPCGCYDGDLGDYWPEFKDYLIEMICSKFGTPKEQLRPLDKKELFSMLKDLLCKSKKLDKPTIAELEKILNSSDGQSLVMLPDGEINCANPSFSIEKIAKEICSKFGNSPTPSVDELFEEIFKTVEIRGLNLSRGQSKIISQAIVTFLEKRK